MRQSTLKWVNAGHDTFALELNGDTAVAEVWLTSGDAWVPEVGGRFTCLKNGKPKGYTLVEAFATVQDQLQSAVGNIRMAPLSKRRPKK